MLKSMTGYGISRRSSDKAEVTVELKSVNNRYLDCNFHLPRGYAALEDPLRRELQNKLNRGKIEVYVSVDTTGTDDTEVIVNEFLADSYVAAIKSLARREGISEAVEMKDLLSLPDVLTVKKKEADTEAIGCEITETLREAMRDFITMRETEGEKLKEDLENGLDRLEKLTNQAEERSPVTVAEYQNRLESKLKAVLQDQNIDETRIVTEAAIFADKVAVAEETVRLKSHIAQFRVLLNEDGPIGKKLDFLIQEMNREANTTGSKGNDTQMARIVVDMKSEIEKLREQIQNIE